MKTMITAHSGCDQTPDNSIIYLQHALNCGADALEIDVRIRPDGCLYLSHDETFGSGILLSDAFALIKPHTMLINCDLKQAGMEQPVLALADSFGILDRVLLSGSVSGESVRNSREILAHTLFNVAIPHSYERTSPQVSEAWADQTVALCRDLGIRTVNVNYEILSDAVIARLHTAGILISAWTVNDPAAAKRLLQHEVYNITSRFPKVVLAIRSQLNGGSDPAV